MPKTNENQRQQMIDRFKAGEKQSQIGAAFGVSTQAVSLIIRRAGLTKRDGGCFVQKAQKQADTERKKALKIFQKYGCTESQLKSVCGSHKDGMKSPLYAFFQQRINAHSRGVGWKISFWQWWMVWDASGKWADRGRGKGMYVMCRIGDEGDYEVGNVYIGTCEGNSSEGRTLAHERGGNKTDAYRVIRAAGGRKAVGEAFGYAPSFISQIGARGAFPPCWRERGLLPKVAAMTGGKYSVADLDLLTPIAGESRGSVFRVTEEAA